MNEALESRNVRPIVAASAAAFAVAGLVAGSILGTSLAGNAAGSLPPAPMCVRPDAANSGSDGLGSAFNISTVATHGTVISDRTISGNVTISANNVKFVNTRVIGQILVTGDNILLDRVDAKNIVIAGSKNVTIQSSEISGGPTAIHVTQDRGPDEPNLNLRVIGTYIHDPVVSSSYSGVHLRGATGVAIMCTNFEIGAYGNGAVFAENANGGTKGVLVANSWISGGAYGIMSAAEGLVMTRNVFSGSSAGSCKNTSLAPTMEAGNRTSSGAPVYPCGQAPDPAATTTSSPSASTTTPATTTSTPATTTPTTTTTPTPTPTTTPTATTVSSTAPAAVPETPSDADLQIVDVAAPIPPTCVKPTAATTGAFGTRAVSSKTVLGNGEILKNATVKDLVISGARAKLYNVQVTGSILITGDYAYLDRVTTTHIGVSSAQNVRIQNSNISGGSADGIHITSDRGRTVKGVVLYHNYIHEPAGLTQNHYDGTQIRGADGVQISCSVYDAGAYKPTWNSAVFLENANGGTRNVQVRDNWFYGYAFSIMVDATNAKFIGNRVGGQIKWGPCYVNTTNGTVFTSDKNVWDATGAPLNFCGMPST